VRICSMPVLKKYAQTAYIRTSGREARAEIEARRAAQPVGGGAAGADSYDAYIKR